MFNCLSSFVDRILSGFFNKINCRLSISDCPFKQAVVNKKNRIKRLNRFNRREKVFADAIIYTNKVFMKRIKCNEKNLFLQKHKIKKLGYTVWI